MIGRSSSGVKPTAVTIFTVWRAYKARIQARVAYRMPTKQLPVDGVGERLTCPAAGPAPLVKCDNKPASNGPRPHTAGQRARHRRPPADPSARRHQRG